MKGISMKAELAKEYRWVSMLDTLTHGDITKNDDVLDKTYLSILQVLGLWNEKRRIDEINNPRNDTKLHR